MDDDKYLTIDKPSEGIYKDKGSKFLAYAFPVNTESDVKRHIKDLKKKYYDARHHVYAFRLGAQMDTFRCSDDGEPSNSSGPPVLGQIQSYNITNVLIVVVRYFGGTKLGVAGLINAYRSAAIDAIENNEIVEKFDEDIIEINFSYIAMNDVMRVVKDMKPNQLEQNFDNSCTMKLSIRKSEGQQLRAKLNKVDGLIIE